MKAEILRETVVADVFQDQISSAYPLAALVAAPILTEVGILHQMTKDNPTKTLIPAPSNEENTCACSECHFMKMNTLEKIYLALKYEQPEILMEEELRLKALTPLKRMLELSK